MVALSLAETEYTYLSFAVCQAIWLQGILNQLQYPQDTPAKIYRDDKSAIALTNNLVFHVKSKRIHIKYHFICKLVGNGDMAHLYKVSFHM